MTRSEAIALLKPKPPFPPEERESFVGVTNAYLEHRLERIGHPAAVEGTPELLKTCACCQYRSLREPSHEVCRVCFWEDDATRSLQRMRAMLPSRVKSRVGARAERASSVSSAGSTRIVTCDERVVWSEGLSLCFISKRANPNQLESVGFSFMRAASA